MGDGGVGDGGVGDGGVGDFRGTWREVGVDWGGLLGMGDGELGGEDLAVTCNCLIMLGPAAKY